MEEFIQVEGISSIVALVPVSSYDNLPKEIKRATIKMAVTCCGFCTAIISQELVDAASKMDWVTAEMATTFRVGPMISVLKDISDLMSQEEFMAILYHEDAHILHGDVANKATDVTLYEGTCFALNLDWELAADAYAASKTSPMIVQQALASAFHATGTFVESTVPAGLFNKDEYLRLMFTDDGVVARMTALEALKG